MSSQETEAAVGEETAAAPPPAELSPLMALAGFFPKPDDEAYGLIWVVQEHFPEAQIQALKKTVAAVPPAIQAGWSHRWRGEKVSEEDERTWGTMADTCAHILVGLLGCIRGGVLDDAREALVKLGQPALRFLDAATDFGYSVDNQDGHNIMELFGEKNMWDKQLRITAARIDPKRGGLVSRVLGFFS